MAGGWNEKNWFNLTYYAELDIDPYYEYEQSIILSDGDAGSRDLSPDPGNRAMDKV